MKKHSLRAGALSTLFMGLGQLYNGQVAKGLIFAACEAGFLLFLLPFVKQGLRGIVTLGDHAQTIQNGKIVQGDHSIFLLVMGILSILLLAAILTFYILSVRDAIAVGLKRMANVRPNKIGKSLSVLSDKGFPYLLLLPAALFIILFNLLPLVFGILVSFTNYSSPNHLPPRNLVDWVGLQNYLNLFKLKAWSNTLVGVSAWTFVWALAASLSTYFFGFIMAVLVNSRGVNLKRLWRTIYIIPWAMPSFISIFVMRNLFNGQFGPINQYLSMVGLGGVPWLTDPLLAKITCILVNLWFGMPYYMALISGVIAGLPSEYYELAKIEGASPLAIFKKITFPLVTFATAPLVITSFGFNFNNFSMIYILTSGDPVNKSYAFAGNTDILISWIYKLTVDKQQYGIASAVYVIIFIIISLISVYSLKHTMSFKQEDMMR